MRSIGFAGAGFACAVLARQLVTRGAYRATVFESRDHIAGNCHTSRDNGIMVHRYGPHIFNTSREEVWDYVRDLSPMMPFTNRVKAVTARGVFSLPINLLTINQFFGKRFSPEDARAFVATLGDTSIGEPQNFEEQALKFLGNDLYRNFFYGYTRKQWGVEPTELPASILRRLPVRFNYDDNYYNHTFQGIPRDGYTSIVEKLLDHPRIEVRLGEPFARILQSEFDHVFYSGPLDGYFEHRHGRLQYRSLVFERFDESGDYQGNPVINYCEEQVPYTRITEHKHFAPWEEHAGTICFREYSKATEPGDTPYYPMRLQEDKERLSRYRALAERTPGLTFIGRLGTYRYLDMHVVIGESLDLANLCLGKEPSDWPSFSNPDHP